MTLSFSSSSTLNDHRPLPRQTTHTHRPPPLFHRPNQLHPLLPTNHSRIIPGLSPSLSSRRAPNPSPSSRSALSSSRLHTDDPVRPPSLFIQVSPASDLGQAILYPVIRAAQPPSSSLTSPILDPTPSSSSLSCPPSSPSLHHPPPAASPSTPRSPPPFAPSLHTIALFLHEPPSFPALGPSQKPRPSPSTSSRAFKPRSPLVIPPAARRLSLLPFSSTKKPPQSLDLPPASLPFSSTKKPSRVTSSPASCPPVPPSTVNHIRTHNRPPHKLTPFDSSHH